jgi:hypothetical protein
VRTAGERVRAEHRAAGGVYQDARREHSRRLSKRPCLPGAADAGNGCGECDRLAYRRRIGRGVKVVVVAPWRVLTTQSLVGTGGCGHDIKRCTCARRWLRRRRDQPWPTS